MNRNNTFTEIWNKLKQSKNIGIAMHSAPDGDSLGACTAMKYMLEKELNHTVTIFSSDFLSENLSKLSCAKEVEFNKDLSEIDFGIFDAFIFMDSEISNFSSKLRKNFKIPEKIFTINIDHHETNSFFGNLNYVDVKSPAICSVLLDFFRNVQIDFDPELARRLFIGIFTDTGYFQYDTSPEKALKDAVFLIEHGVDYHKDILVPILYSTPLKLKKYFGLLLNNLQFDKKRKVGYSFVKYETIKELGLNDSDVRLGINELQFISEFDVIFTLAELKNNLKGSFRSKKGIDVSLFAKELGGGGHKAASAFILEKMPLNKAVETVFKAIDRIIGNSIK